MKSRVEINSEPRTAQFLIERPCPIEGADGEPPVPMPFPVWVYVGLPAPSTYAHEMCDAEHYRMTRDSAVHFGVSFSVAWVCGHMGRLIE